MVLLAPGAGKDLPRVKSSKSETVNEYPVRNRNSISYKTVNLPLGECFSVYPIVLSVCQPEMLPLKDFCAFFLVGSICADAVLSPFPREAILVDFFLNCLLLKNFLFESLLAFIHRCVPGLVPGQR